MCAICVTRQSRWDQILVEIRTYESANHNLSDNAGLARGFDTSSKRCYKCNNLAHLSKDCVLGSQAAEGPRKQANTECGYCGGPKRCRMKTSPAFSAQCGSCKGFGHYTKCCLDMTQSIGQGQQN